MCCCVFWVRFSTTLMFVYFFFPSYSVAAYPRGFFLFLFFFTSPICVAISVQYICVSTGLRQEPEKGRPARSSVPRIGAAHSSVKRLCVFTCGRRRPSPSLYTRLFWPLMLERRRDESSHPAALLTSALLSQPHLTPQGDLIAAASAGPSPPLCWGIKGCCHCEQRHTSLGRHPPPPSHPHSLCQPSVCAILQSQTINSNNLGHNLVISLAEPANMMDLK